MFFIYVDLYDGVRIGTKLEQLAVETESMNGEQGTIRPCRDRKNVF